MAASLRRLYQRRSAAVTFKRVRVRIGETILSGCLTQPRGSLSRSARSVRVRLWERYRRTALPAGRLGCRLLPLSMADNAQPVQRMGGREGWSTQVVE